MFGLMLVFFAMLSSEVGSSIGKRKVEKHEESIYTMGFLNFLWGTLFLITLAFLIPKDFFAPGFPGGFIFSLESLPTFLTRLFLEIIQVHITILALVKAERSTFGFLRIITIPLLLGVDVLLGYEIDLFQIAGIGLIVLSLVFLFINHGIHRRGVFFVLFSAFNAVITISLFKYNITHFNSVEAEQGITLFVLSVYFFCLALFIAKENPIRFLKQPIFLAQSVTKGVGTIVLSFAYLFAPASIITTAKRSFTILFAMLSGNLYFHEKHFLIKCISFLFIVGGVILLAL